MPLYGAPNHPETDVSKTAIGTEKRKERYPLATLALIWFASPAWGGFLIGWIIVLGLWPDTFTVGVWWMIAITYFISWIAAWITRWYHEDTYATGRKDSPLEQILTGW